MSGDTLDDKLRRAWHSQASKLQIAKEFGMQERELTEHWSRLRREGRLPSRARRMLSENVSDGRPNVNELGEDPLADMLKQGKR